MVGLLISGLVEKNWTTFLNVKINKNLMKRANRMSLSFKSIFKDIKGMGPVKCNMCNT